ncbi:MAG: alanine--tRNA ligase [Woeseiaceae bacterium]|jgi:alanyl-tRNA synthetase|tara:strand:- start:3363 stop:5966 length:2604 start_codon:yes stop_codon:yes gene_type:complete
MKTITSNDLRQKFLDYFHERDHEIVNSSSLVPGNDPTLLFTNAGMVQFKDVFLGNDKRSYQRAVTSQRCLRAGGKHNDLENVGYTAKHHTFFEMLGNFSFGDYFKEKAIIQAWDFLTNTLGLPEEKLWITVFSEDDEAADIWLNKIKVNPERFSRMGEKDNFWSMGDTGPCGPCSEIFYDHGPEVSGGPPGSEDEDGDRYSEIWNLVFMQFDRSEDGAMTPLPKPSVDTGMGLERLAAVMQSVHSNYEIDLFKNLITASQKILKLEAHQSSSLNVIVDHIRACSFLIVDDVMPGNEGRSYVLRRILRRAIRHGKKLGINEPFFFKLVTPLVKEMGEAYPELVKLKSIIENTIKEEELRFAITLDQGMEILESSIKSMKDKLLPGEIVFKLYDTYGFPVDLTNDIARERHFEIDMDGFEVAMQSQRSRAREANKFSHSGDSNIKAKTMSKFVGYECSEDKAEITELFLQGKTISILKKGQQGILVTNITPFYAESGGQIGDTGRIDSKKGSFSVTDTQKQGNTIIHHGVMEDGELKISDKVAMKINSDRRSNIAANHSATHLMHAALRNVLSDQVTQKGSLVDENRLRFDFSHNKPLSKPNLFDIEAEVNSEIRKNYAARTELMSYDNAIKSGAMALFGEKYEDEVRVLDFGGYSIELCGGTHVKRTGDVGIFKIITESGVASGVRRIEAVTGDAALQWLSTHKENMDQLATLLKSSPDQIYSKIEQLLVRNKAIEKELSAVKQKMLGGNSNDLMSKAIKVGEINILIHRMDGVDSKNLRIAIDQFKDKLGTAVVVLGSIDEGKVKLAVGVTNDLTDQIRAGDLIQSIAATVGGKGGGRPDFAQAGGPKRDKIDQALKLASDLIKNEL